MRINRGWVLVIGVLVIATVGTTLLVLAVRSATERALRPLEQSNHSLQTQVANLFNPTPTVMPDPVTIVNEVRSLARLESIQYSVEKVITAETAQGPFGFLFGDKLIFVAHGTAIAGVDLGKLGPGDITLVNGTVTIHLPAPEIFVAMLDNQKSYVYNRTTGALTHGDTNLETTARRAAEDEIRQAALEDGILNLAQSNAESFITHLLENLGYKDIRFIESPFPTVEPTPIG
jgi:hypothetical protein